MKTYTVDYNLLASSADTLLTFDYFSQHVETIADVIAALTKQEDLLVKRLADMLIQMATHVQNCESGRLAANLCTVFDGGEEIRQ
ncbi:hypothetical protein PT286_04985 [Neisseriaceae bacterium ESL0693]|nr:hypothetical protein [Neisseriaceae bacterium ESL0693]